MRKVRLVWFISIVLFYLSACEKAVNFKLKEGQPKLVVEAIVENGQAPIVFLSTSMNYFSAINPQILANSFVHNADVYVSNGNKTHKLKEYTIVEPSGYNLYYYSIDSSSLATAFVGELNKQYSLRISNEGKEYTSTTTIPTITKKVDSLWWKSAPEGIDSNKVIVMVRATDPAGYGDYIRYLTKRNREPFYPGLTSSVYDDLFIDGTSYELQVEPGFDRNIERKEEDYFFSKGDTVILRLSNIDKATYDFWRTIEFGYASVGNPFSSPVKVIGNISNGALGYFGGYASQYHTIIIPQ